MQTDFVNYAEDIMLLQWKMKFMLCLTVKPMMILETLYIDRDALTCANEYNFIKLMNADNTDCIVKLAKICVTHV